jgi:ribonuclease-3 family protein
LWIQTDDLYCGIISLAKGCRLDFDKNGFFANFLKKINEYGAKRSEEAGCSPESADLRQSRLQPLVLAYVGDSVYELYVRGMLTRQTIGSVHKLHLEATEFARSASQADVIHNIYDSLTEPERDIVRRGRNISSGYVPKNANIAQYRYATGFEALLGFLYMNGEIDRLIYILNMAVNRVAIRCAESDSKNDAKI